MESSSRPSEEESEPVIVLVLTGYGWEIYLYIVVTQMRVDQEQLGTSGGLVSLVRYAGGFNKTPLLNSVLGIF